MGYDTGLFMDLAACPPTIDFQGPDGMTFYRATQLRYEANLMKGLKVGNILGRRAAMCVWAEFCVA